MSDNLPGSVEGVWLFGSFARGRSNGDSDLDLLVLGTDGTPPPSPCSLKNTFKLPLLPEVSHYTRSGIRRVTRPASLFAWHLRLEGRPLFERTDWLQNELQTLEPYTAHSEDLRVLSQLFIDAKRSIEDDQRSLVFDTAVLGIIARNVSLVMTHFDGAPDFSVEAPLRLLTHPTTRFPLMSQEYALLHRCRLAVERGADSPELSLELVRPLACRIGDWLVQVERYVEGGSCHA